MVCENVLGDLLEVVVSKGEWVEVLLVVAESDWPRSWSVIVGLVWSGDSAAIVVGAATATLFARSDTGRLGVEEKFMLPASPVSKGCRTLLSRTCCRRSE